MSSFGLCFLLTADIRDWRRGVSLSPAFTPSFFVTPSLRSSSCYLYIRTLFGAGWRCSDPRVDGVARTSRARRRVWTDPSCWRASVLPRTPVFIPFLLFFTFLHLASSRGVPPFVLARRRSDVHGGGGARGLLVRAPYLRAPREVGRARCAMHALSRDSRLEMSALSRTLPRIRAYGFAPSPQLLGSRPRAMSLSAVPACPAEKWVRATRYAYAFLGGRRAAGGKIILGRAD
ncbi:hypothetical protein C8J57DRAFT_1537060 [Mycena rebaudengoi]|nr:hypothetical protein C8J57DRAFT_1537060 [Mycena rebaudengoi]